MTTKRTFPASELIINSDGSCFHLHLKPEFLADRVVLVGDPARVNTVAAHFDSIEHEVTSREFHTITGTYKGKRITCQSHGIGCDNIDIVVNELDTLANIDKQHATSSVILYAMMHFFAHFWFWFISIFIYLALVLVGDMPMTTAIGTVLGTIILFCLLAFYIFSRGYRHGLVVYVLGLIGKIPFLKGWSRRFRGNHAEALRNIDAQISALYSQDTKAFYSSLILEYSSRMVQSLEVMFMLLLFGIDNGGGLDGMVLTYLHSVLIVAFTTLFANLIGFLPMQIGVQEGGFVLSIAALGLSAALGIFVSIICRVREIIWIAVGMALMKLRD